MVAGVVFLTPVRGHKPLSHGYMPIMTRTLIALLSLVLFPALLLADSRQALIAAVQDGQLTRVEILLDNGTSPEASSGPGEHEGKTVLMWAAEQGREAIAQRLIDYGALPDRTNSKGGTALMYAAVAGQTAMVRLLIEAGANPDHRVRHGWTPLLLATVKGHVATVQALADYGARLDTRDVYGWTLLMHAVDRQDIDMVRALLDLGLDPAEGDGNGNTALTLAAQTGHAELAEMLGLD